MKENHCLFDIDWDTGNGALDRSLPQVILVIGCPFEVDENLLVEFIGKQLGYKPAGFTGGRLEHFFREMGTGGPCPKVVSTAWLLWE